MPKKKNKYLMKGFFGIAKKNVKKYGAGKSRSGIIKAGLQTFIDTPIEGIKQAVTKRKKVTKKSK